jgi:hypothetical protein
MMARNWQRALSVLAFFLVASSALVAASDDCAGVPDPHCPFCQLANLPMTAPAQTPQVARPEMAEWYFLPSIAAKGHECKLEFSFSRAPPA